MLRNTKTDIRYGSTGQGYEKAISIRELARSYAASSTTTPPKEKISSDEISIGLSSSNQYHIGGNDNQNQSAVGKGIGKNIRALQPSTRANLQDQNRQKNVSKKLRNSRFIKFHTATPIAQQSEFPNLIVRVVGNKLPERHVPEEVFSPSK